MGEGEFERRKRLVNPLSPVFFVKMTDVEEAKREILEAVKDADLLRVKIEKWFGKGV